MNLLKPNTTIQKMKDKQAITLAALGDSLTFGWMVKKGYLDFLLEMLSEKYAYSDITILNRGVPGDTAYGGLNRVDREVIAFKPDIVLVQFALNDAFAGYSPSDFIDALQQIIDKIKNNTKAEIMLVTSTFLFNNMENRVADVFYNLLNKVAIKNSLPIAKVHEYWTKKIDADHATEYVLEDCVHPNSSGYRLMAEAIMEIL